MNYLDCEMWVLVSWKAELPKKKGSHKEEVIMENRRGVKKRKVMILAGGNPQ